MLLKNIRIIYALLGMLLIAVIAQAGGFDPKDMPAQEPVAREKISATPQQTSAAVNQARRAVVPAVQEVPLQAVQPIAVQPIAMQPIAMATASKDSWLLSSSQGQCSPLADVRREVTNIGTFKTPQEFAHQMKQRGYLTFVLDIGDTPDQKMRIKVPDLQLELLFVRPELCR